MPAAQTYKNHTRFDTKFHFVLMPILLINFIATIVFAVRHWGTHSYHGLWQVVMAFALILLAGLARSYALKVQDRVIRLEEKARLATLVSASELMELESLTVRQYVGLRFASNVELPDLARRAVREKLTNKQIKQAVVSWRPDYDRV
jgi:hypothetical protein